MAPLPGHLWNNDSQKQEDPVRELLKKEGAIALGKLFIQHSAALRGMVRVRLHPILQGRIDPCDVIQDVFLEALERLPEYLLRFRQKALLWIRLLTLQRLQIIHRRHLDTKKRDVRRENVLEQSGSTDPSTIPLPSLFADPLDRVCQEEQLHKLHGALEQMDERDREILVMRHFEHLSNEKTAQVLGISTTAAHKRYYRALRKLKDLFPRM